MKEAANRQKLAATGFGLMLRQLYDWENLQTAKTRQHQAPPRTPGGDPSAAQSPTSIIGREARISTKTLDKILTLSQKQKTALEAERPGKPVGRHRQQAD